MTNEELKKYRQESRRKDKAEYFKSKIGGIQWDDTKNEILLDQQKKQSKPKNTKTKSNNLKQKLEKIFITIILLSAFILVTKAMAQENPNEVAKKFYNENDEVITKFFDGIQKPSSKTKIKVFELIQTCTYEDDHCKAQKILDYISNIDYQLNPRNSSEYTGTAEQLITKDEGNCLDKTLATVMMLKIAKVKSLIVYHHVDQYTSHIFPIINISDDKMTQPYCKEYNAYFTIKNKRYWMAEPTSKKAYLGCKYWNWNTPYKIYDPFTKEKIK